MTDIELRDAVLRECRVRLLDPEGKRELARLVAGFSLRLGPALCQFVLSTARNRRLCETLERAMLELELVESVAAELERDIMRDFEKEHLR